MAHAHHHHNGGHHHHGEQGRHYAEANAKFFDEMGGDGFLVRPHAVEHAKRSAEAIRKITNITDQTTLMEYACGPGLVSGNLLPYVKSIVGVDISQKMVDHFNDSFVKNDIPPEKAKGVRAELKGVEGELDGRKFDVVICTAAYHHFPDILETTKILVSFLNPGGTLVIIDLCPGSWDGTVSEQVEQIVAHKHGFSKEEIETVFQKAQLSSVIYERMAGVEGDSKLFIAKGVKE